MRERFSREQYQATLKAEGAMSTRQETKRVGATHVLS